MSPLSIALGVLLLLLLALLIPIKLWLRYEEKAFSLKLGYLWAKLTLYPEPKQPDKPTKPKSAAQKPKKKKSEPKRAPIQDLEEGVALLLRTLPRIWQPVRWLLRHTAVAKVDLRVRVSRGDAAETALAFGRWQMMLSNALAALSGVVKLKLERIELTPDFTGSGDAHYLSAEVRLIPLFGLVVALNIATTLFWVALRLAFSGAKSSKQPQKERESTHGKQTPHQ